MKKTLTLESDSANISRMLNLSEEREQELDTQMKQVRERAAERYSENGDVPDDVMDDATSYTFGKLYELAKNEEELVYIFYMLGSWITAARQRGELMNLLSRLKPETT